MSLEVVDLEDADLMDLEDEALVLMDLGESQGGSGLEELSFFLR